MKTLQKRLQRLDAETVSYVEAGIITGIVASIPYWVIALSV